MYGLLDLGSWLYGTAMIVLVTTFITTGKELKIFVRALAPLLFVVGTILCLSGVLAIRSKVDRSLGRVRRGRGALVLGTAKAVAGGYALMLLWIGLSI